jgi:hypothetical protein
MADFARRDRLGRRIWWAPSQTYPPMDIALEEPEHRQQFQLAWQGAEPADALTPHDRHVLVARLWERNWTDSRIAGHTQMTLATTARIRMELGLAPRE